MLKETIYVSNITLQGICNTEEDTERAFEEFKRKRIYNSDRIYIVRINVVYPITEFEFYRVIA